MKKHSAVGLITNSSTTIFYAKQYIPLSVAMIIDYNAISYPTILVHLIGRDKYRTAISRHSVALKSIKSLGSYWKPYNIEYFLSYYENDSSPFFSVIHPIMSDISSGDYALFVSNLMRSGEEFKKTCVNFKDIPVAYVYRTVVNPLTFAESGFLSVFHRFKQIYSGTLGDMKQISPDWLNDYAGLVTQSGKLNIFQKYMEVYWGIDETT